MVAVIGERNFITKAYEKAFNFLSDTFKNDKTVFSGIVGGVGIILILLFVVCLVACGCCSCCCGKNTQGQQTDRRNNSGQNQKSQGQGKGKNKKHKKKGQMVKGDKYNETNESKQTLLRLFIGIVDVPSIREIHGH